MRGYSTSRKKKRYKAYKKGGSTRCNIKIKNGKEEEKER